ncbi:MAG TPA: TlpA disulfide reductase family protein [Gemmataceae bacterium]|jgi:thiol-disulfide isomerase/thioredoxin|nr:TlpA disulfide reductase family protein [Gemmataceae bacterium]
MRRVLFASLIVISGGLWVALADEPKAADSAQGRKLAQIKKKFDADLKELKKKEANAKDPEDKQQVKFLIKELNAFAASDAIEVAEENKKDEGALDACVFALKMLGQFQITGADMDKATTIVLENHLDSPKIGAVLGVMVDCGRPGQIFLETVLEKAMNSEVQALAIYYNALAKSNRINAAEGPGTDEKKVAMARAEVVEAMEKAAKQAPDAKVDDDTLAKVVANEIEAMKIAVGNALPEVEGIDLAGKKVKLSTYKGKVVLFDVWATWCPPCRAMIPHEREMVEKMANKPFALISVSVDDEKETLTEFLGKETMPWNHWWDGAHGPLAKKFRVNAFPTLYLIDAKGVIRKKWTGSPGNDVLDKAVEELVDETAKEKN